MWSGRVFQVAGPACENARSPDFVCSRGREWSIDEVEDEHSPERDLLAPTDWLFPSEHRRFVSSRAAYRNWNLALQGTKLSRKL